MKGEDMKAKMRTKDKKSIRKEDNTMPKKTTAADAAKTEAPVSKSKYYTAKRSMTDTIPAKLQGLVIPIDDRTFYVDLMHPIDTEKRQGDRIIWSKREYPVKEITNEPKSSN